MSTGSSEHNSKIPLWAVAKIKEQQEAIRELVAGLTRIANCDGSPDIDPMGDIQLGLHCGVEDIGCQDRYDGVDYGYTQGMERGIEWAVNEAAELVAKHGGE